MYLFSPYEMLIEDMAGVSHFPYLNMQVSVILDDCITTVFLFRNLIQHAFISLIEQFNSFPYINMQVIFILLSL